MYYAQRHPDRQCGSNAEPISMLFEQWGAPVDLSTATVTFTMQDANTGTVAVNNRPAQGSPDGVADYRATLAELAVPGEYACQFVATFADDRVQRSEVFYMRLIENTPFLSVLP